MKAKILSLMLLAFFVAGFSVTAFAEPGRFNEEGPAKERLEKIRKKIEALRIWKLAEALDLDEETSSKLFPVLKKYDRRRAKAQRELRQGMKELKLALKAGKEESLTDIIDRLEQSHKALQRINDEERQALKRILTVKQQAQYILFQQRFKREIRKIIAEARRGGRRDLRRDRPFRDDNL